VNIRASKFYKVVVRQHLAHVPLHYRPCYAAVTPNYKSWIPRLDLVGYYRPMTFRWSSLAVIAALCTLLPGCKSRPKAQPVQVRIYHDLSSPYGPALDHRILDFEATNPRLSNGSVVEVGNLGLTSLQSALNHLDDPAVDIVILDSPNQALEFPVLQPEMSHAVNVCAALEACPAEIPALVPSKVQGDRAEAANKFVQYLASRTMPPPATQPASPESPPAQTPPADSAKPHS